MRCEDCLAVVEEYFDGELERRQSEQVSAHMAACEDCAEALDALASEQEMYLRYDRGLEVSPALWENVRAGVARLEETETAVKPLPPFTRLRERLAHSFARIAPRAAFAPALALFVLAAFVGALWLARTRQTLPAPEVAQAPPRAGRAEADPQPSASPEPGAPPSVAAVSDGGDADQNQAAPAATLDRGGTTAALVNAVAEKTPVPARTRPAAAALTPPPAPNHLEAAEADLFPSTRPDAPESADVLLASSAARLPSPEEKEMARHLEQAQTLLRSFQNEAASGGDAVQIAYERRLSRKLLADNATLQLEAEASGDKETRKVLDTLEPFLLDIANLRDNASRDEVRSIKERMQKKEIIAALHVY